MASGIQEKVGSQCCSFTPTFLFVPSNLHEESSAFSFLNAYTSFLIKRFFSKKMLSCVFSLRLMLLSKKVVDGLYRIESSQWYLYKDGIPVAHGTVP